MMKIESLVSRPDRVGRHLVKFSNGTSMRLYRQTVEDFGLYTGMELTDQVFADLCKAAGSMSAKMRAVRIVAASNVSRADLQQRLVQKGESARNAQEAVEWMDALQLLDDEKTASLLVQRCVAKGYGRARAKQMLYEKRIPKELWEKALEDYPDQTEKIVVFLQGKLGEDPDAAQIKRAVDALLRRGHSYPEIRSALSRLSSNMDPFQEDF